MEQQETIAVTTDAEQPRSEQTRVERLVSHCLSVVSFGGGVNSTAMLIGMHERGERPDAILFADTGGEKPATYKHIETMDTWCKANGLPSITRVAESKTLEADCLEREALPGKVYGFGSCSEHFKIRPMRRWLKVNAHSDVMWFVGIHIGERHRAERQLNQREDTRFPLIEWGWGHDDCENAIKRHGFSVPCKSACFFCPAMRKMEVIQLSKESPELFARAVAMERNAIDAGTLETVKGLGRRWTWEQLVAADARQQRLFTDDQSPLCDVCLDG